MELLLGRLQATTASKAAATPSPSTAMTRIMLVTRVIGFWLCGCCLGAAAAYCADGPQTLNQLRKEAAEQSRVAEAQPQAAGRLKLDRIQGADSTPSVCPNPAALDFFEYQITYQRTEELDPFKGLQQLRADVWQRGPLTAFYVREKLNGFARDARMTYLFGKKGLHGGGTCPVQQNWRACVEGFAGLEYVADVVETCTISLDMSTVPVWRPSPNDQTKRRIAEELRNEIETKWRGVQEIVIRDFNLEDNQITMYLKMPDGDYYEGCGFHAMSEPHCEGWHVFGTSPVSTSTRRWIFELPYRLK